MLERVATDHWAGTGVEGFAGGGFIDVCFHEFVELGLGLLDGLFLLRGQCDRLSGILGAGRS